MKKFKLMWVTLAAVLAVFNSFLKKEKVEKRSRKEAKKYVKTTPYKLTFQMCKKTINIGILV